MKEEWEDERGGWLICAAAGTPHKTPPFWDSGQGGAYVSSLGLYSSVQLDAWPVWGTGLLGVLCSAA
jgi:hypothetical protein